MAKIKITKEQIVPGAEFILSMGTVKIIAVDVDGYRKGLNRVRTEMSGRPYADTPGEIRAFINENLKS